MSTFTSRLKYTYILTGTLLYERQLREALLDDKGSGCEIPHLDPLAQEVTKFNATYSKVVCSGLDWVKCYLSECKVVPDILETKKDLSCAYYDIIYESDRKYHLGLETVVLGSDEYTLTDSDHVKIACTGTSVYGTSENQSEWEGYGAGFRTEVERKPVPLGREEALNVIIFGFDSTSKNGFIRSMPKSYTYITQMMNATVLNGYNIVGHGTSASLFPILTGRNELELPDVRKRWRINGSLEDMPFIFYTLKKDGYFLRLDGKKFIFTFIADICHDNFNMISTADDDMVEFLKTLVERRVTKDTLILIMGDHGRRYSAIRNTLQRKLEERLPLMAIILPEELKHRRLDVQSALEANANVLTSPYDIHTTLLDVVDLPQHSNLYKVPGADLLRGISLLEAIPKNRSCSEAGIAPHWCSCLTWQYVMDTDKMYERAVDTFIEYVNSLTEEVRVFSLPKVLGMPMPYIFYQLASPLLNYNKGMAPWEDLGLLKPRWPDGLFTMRSPNAVEDNMGDALTCKKTTSFSGLLDRDGYIPRFDAHVRTSSENYQVKVIMDPGQGIYEASMMYITHEDKFFIDSKDVSRTNAYGDEPSCISAKMPHLNPYCYCKDNVSQQNQ